MNGPRLDQLRLPPKPVDPRGRYVAWLWVTGAPGFWYEGRRIDVDSAWIDRLLAVHAAITDEGYLLPLLEEHEPDGTRWGDVLQLARVESPAGPQLVAAAAFAAADAEEAIQQGAIAYTSPGLKYDYTDHKGRKHPLALLELSIVSAPHQKTGGTHVLASERTKTMDGKPATNAARSIEDRMTDAETTLAAQGSTLGEIKTMLEAMKPAAPAPPAAPVEGMGAPADVKMSERVLGLEAQLKAEKEARLRAELDASLNASPGRVLPLDAPEVREMLLREQLRDPDSLKKIALKAVAPATPPAKPTPSALSWGAAAGAGTGIQASETTRDAAWARSEAKKAHPTDATASLAEFQRLLTIHNISPY